MKTFTDTSIFQNIKQFFNEKNIEFRLEFDNSNIIKVYQFHNDAFLFIGKIFGTK